MTCEKKRCSKCKRQKSLSAFSQKKCGTYYKTCITCNEASKKSKEKNKCVHNREKCKCKNCGGSQICKHYRRKHYCKECSGSGICDHNRIRSHCKECGGAGICKHNRRRSQCKECDFNGYLGSIIRNRTHQALKAKKSQKTIEYLGCDINTFKKHIEKQFKEGMTWDNYGSMWHIDHIIPLKYNNPTLEQTIKRLHYKNTQPLLASENMSKGNRYVG